MDMPNQFLKHFEPESRDVLVAILTQSRDCIKLVNLAGEIVYINQNGLTALGFDGPDGLIGQPWHSLWPAENAGMIDAAVAAAIAGESQRFEAFCPDRDGRARWWDVAVSPLRGDDGAVSHVLAISRDVTAQVTAREDEHRRLELAERRAVLAREMAREMRHRLKNQLAVVGAVARMLSRHNTDARVLASKLDDRLVALARAQDLLTAHRDRPLPAQDAITQVLEASGAGERIVVRDLPAACLPDESIQLLALILGELQTNALKHGALRGDGGQVEISGTRADQMLTLSWHEDCGEPVVPTETGNGGFLLINRLGSVGNAKPRIAWRDEGIDVDFHLRVDG